MNRIRVLIVDDSKFIRMALRNILEKAEDVQVVGEARDGEEAIRLTEMMNPDVITMDIVMPNMDGLTAIKKIKEIANIPIIVISDHTTEGARITFQALEAGAVDFIPKGSGELKLDMSRLGKELIEKIRLYAGSEKRAEKRPFSTKQTPTFKEPIVKKTIKKVDMVGVGISTGGPKVLPTFLKNMGNIDVPVIIAQHMPATFTASLAEWLSKETHLRVEEGYDGMRLEGGLVVVLPGGKNGSVEKAISGFTLKISEEPPTIIKPSANVLFMSMVRNAQNPLALILTGMGDDGTEGAKEFVKRGYTVIVQEPSTCVVCGMPCSAIQAEAYTYIMTVEEMGRKVRKLCGGL